ncbi:MAG TPA: SDR family oxidoreductase [Polyangiaceae bacterium]|nr:SDR family oxidoreductase [Polyangiaceae bacterium]
MTAFQAKNSVAFVTGTNRERGIGRAVVRALLERGARKVYATARDITQITDLVREGEGRVVPVELDVTDEQAVATLGERFPDVTLVINNAGVFGNSAPLGDATAAAQEMRVNYTAPMLITKSFAPVLAKHAQSAVVNVNSIASFVNFPLGTTYAASKAAAHSLTQAQRRELAPAGTLVVGVYPGPTDTDMADGMKLAKASPSTVAEAVLDALESGTEYVYPDPISQSWSQALQADAKALEREVATMVLP